MNVYGKLRCAALRIKKTLTEIFRELITTTRTTATRVAFWDPPSGSKKSQTWSQNLGINGQQICGNECPCVRVNVGDDA